jgi:RND family efflux transporter MFP subunit
MRKLLTPALVGMAALGLTSCSKPAPPPPTPVVDIATPLQVRALDWDDFSGRFEAPAQVEVRARAGGYLQAVHFRDGQAVTKGQLLFTLDPRPAEAQLASARAQAELAHGELKRAQALLAAQAISREEFEGRRSAALVADATLRARQLDLEFTRVTAPISGVASYHRIDPGNVIAGGSSSGDILTTIVSVNPIHFVFEASEAQALKYQREAQGRGGAPVRVRLQDEAEPRWSGHVDFQDNVVDPASGALRLRAVIANPAGFLKPGMFGAARMVGSGAYAALAIPDTAVISDGVNKTVLVAGPDGAVKVRVIGLGPAVDGLRLVRSGLTLRDHVVVNGAQRVRPGQPVKTKAVRITRAVSTAGSPLSSPAPASTATLVD